MALAMGRWGCWLVVAVHVVVRGKEATLIHSHILLVQYQYFHILPHTSIHSHTLTYTPTYY